MGIWTWDMNRSGKYTKMIKFDKKYRALYILIALNITFFILSLVFSKSLKIKLPVLSAMGAANGDLIRSGDYYRILTSSFLHAGPEHLLINMYSLFVLGMSVINIIGEEKFLVVYFVSAIFAGMTSLLTKHYSVGASGAIFGLLGFILVFALINRKNMKKSVLIEIFSVLGLNLMIGLVPGSGIDNLGHLGGLISGIIISIILLTGEKRKWEQK